MTTYPEGVRRVEGESWPPVLFLGLGNWAVGSHLVSLEPCPHLCVTHCGGEALGFLTQEQPDFHHRKYKGICWLDLFSGNCHGFSMT